MNIENLEIQHGDFQQAHFDEICINSTISIQDQTNRVVYLLSRLDNAFIYAGKLAIIRKGKMLIAVDVTSLMVLLTHFFKFYEVKLIKGDEVVTYHSLDKNVLRFLEAKITDGKIKQITYYANVPVLEKISDHIYRLSQSGYNSKSGVYVGDNKLLPARNKVKLEKVLSSFHFKSSIDKVNIIAFLLTQFFHYLLPGNVPSMRVEANQRGAGKTLLATIVALIYQGKAGHIMSLSDNEEEMDKRLCSILSNGDFVAIFDNVKTSKNLKEIGGMLIERLITAPILQFRFLGKNSIFSVSNYFLTIVTTNGGDTTADYASRSVAFELHVVGNPDGRKFPIKDLLGFVTENLDEIRSELLGMIELWIEASCPLSTKASHRFQSWAEIVGGVLETNGYEGFLSNQREFQQSSGIVSEFQKCIESISKDCPVSAKQLLDRCRPKNDFFLVFNSVPMFSKKILIPLIGEIFEAEDGRKFLFELAGTSSEKSALFRLKSLGNEQESPESDNLLLLTKKVNEVKDLFEHQEKGECITQK